MKKEKSNHIRKPTIFPLIVMFFLLSLFCCSTPLKLENVKNEDLFSVEEIKKVNDSVFLIYASRNDTIFKIASYYDGNSINNCTKLKKKSKFRAKLLSQFKEAEKKFNMFPNYSISFIFHGITICREPEKNIDDVYLCDTLNGCFLIEQVRWTMYTKGAVLLVCFQCVDTLVFESKHAEGMSLRCDAPSLIVAGMNHRILSRLTQIQRNSTRWLFVGICGGLWVEKISAIK